MRFVTLISVGLLMVVPAFVFGQDDSEKPTDTTTLAWPVEIPKSVDPAWVKSVARDQIPTDLESVNAVDDSTSQADGLADSPQAVLQKFLAANEVFASGKIVPTQFADGLYSHPRAVVLQCAESMPDPYLIFGQPQGTIAVVRNMANIIPLAGLQPDSVDTGSIEYSVINQGARLIIVLGHTNCEVMQKVVAKWNEIKGKTTPLAGPGNQIPPANLGAIYQVLYPAVTKANKDSEVDLLGASIRNNVTNTVAGLQGDTFIFSKLVQSGELLIVGAVYDPETRKVELLDK